MHVLASIGYVDAHEYTFASIAGLLKAARQKAGLSVDELARRVKVPKSYVESVESGDSTETLISEGYVAAVLRACGLPDDWRP